MSQRTRVRQIVLQILFQEDLNSTDGFDWETFLRDRLQRDRALVQFGNGLLEGVRQRRDEIDQLLQAASANWRVSRMPPVDRNVLRLAVWEMKYTTTPPRVALNEAINLAKRFGGKNSPQFVNGILDRVLKDLSPESGPADVASVVDAPQTL